MPVYFIGQLDRDGKSIIKIGIAIDITRRHRALQTGNPIATEIMGWIVADDDYRLERDLHNRFESRHRLGEWFDIAPADVFSELQRAGRKGFVAKNADAFEIVGVDRDGVAEYAGVWVWQDLEFEDCCPLCGCCCGMHFQDTSSMYYCMNCQELTDFPEAPAPDEDR
ncbi:GIY-YIG nuclease family protein [Tardiphaga sp. P5_C7]